MAQAASLAGYYIVHVTLVLWVGTSAGVGAAGAAAAVAALLACATVPALLRGPIASLRGPVARLAGRGGRQAMRSASLVRAGLAASLVVPMTGAAASSVPVQLAWAYLVAAGTAVGTHVFDAARSAVTAASPEPARAMRRARVITHAAAVAGPPMGALLFVVGAPWAICVAAATLLVSFAVAPAATGNREHRTSTPSAGAALAAVAGNPVLVHVAIVLAVAPFTAAAINTVHLFFIMDNLRVAAAWLGVLVGAFGAGGVLGGALGGRLVARIESRWVLAAGLILGGASMAAYSRLTALPAGALVMVLAGLPLGALNTTVTPLVRQAIGHRSHLGLAALQHAVPVAYLAGLVAAGVTATVVLPRWELSWGQLGLGRYDTVLLACGLLMLAAGCWATRIGNSAGMKRSDNDSALGPDGRT